MECRKCKKVLPEIDGLKFCPFCAAPTESKRTGSRRPNSTGTAYKRGKTWRAEVVVGTYAVTKPDGTKGIRKIKKSKEGFARKSDALNHCAKLIEQYGQGQKQESRIIHKSLKDCYDLWVPFYAPRVSEGQMKSHAAAVKWLKDLWAVDMDKLTSNQLQAAIDACPRKRRTKEDIKSLLMLLFKFGIQNDFCRTNRAEYLYCGDDDGQSWPPFSRDEVERIRTCGLPYADYVYVMIYTGYRPTELLTLRKTDYDREHGILFAGIKTEAGKDRHMPVSAKIRPIIDRQFSAAGDLMFPDIGNGQEMSDDAFRVRAFEPLMAALGIEGKVPYSCRHTFSNLLKDAVGSDKEKAALMGHTDYALTKRVYQSAEDQALAAIIAQI